MKIQIGSNGYFTGNYAIIGNIENGVEYSGEIPTENATAYKLVNGVLVFDENAVIVPTEQPTTEDRLEALEAAMLEMIIGGST